MLPKMSPAPGERVQKFVGDRVRFDLRDQLGRKPEAGWKGVLRTNLGRAESLRREILHGHTRGVLPAGSSWRDIPMEATAAGWTMELALAEPGFFRAKCYLLDPNGWQHWPEGSDFGISVHPDCYRTANIVYCAFTRLFGAVPDSRKASAAIETVPYLDRAGYSVIPPSGKLRDLTKQVPHIVERLGCRIIQLLPVNPTPTTYARFGRFGSPYAALDLAAVDPALVEFDKRTTGIDQFQELTRTVHAAGAKVFLDIVINHTGWGSVLQERHPEWFLRMPTSEFKSPGAWGTVWEDLVELKHDNVALWDILSDVFLTWCKRGVDGFRCDAGYMVPVNAWQYIVAKVQQQYPNTVFLLEGLGGAWSATEGLLTDGGMQWAYSELFQNYTGKEVASYLDHSLAQSERVGLLVHYSETHDNSRLAARGPEWSLMRNHLCALASRSGAFGFTCGVEWLADEKIRVHERTSMNWGASRNLLPELSQLNKLLANHPCFFDGAKVTRLSGTDSPVLALARRSEDDTNLVLVLINLDPSKPHNLLLDEGTVAKHLGNASLHELSNWNDLLEGDAAKSACVTTPDGNIQFTLAAAATRALTPRIRASGLCGESYREARARAAWAIQALSHVLPLESLGPAGWQELSSLVDADPARFLGSLKRLDPERAKKDLLDELKNACAQAGYSNVVRWTGVDARRITPVPPEHWILIELPDRFHVHFRLEDVTPINAESTPFNGYHIAFIPPQERTGKGTLTIERFGADPSLANCKLRYVPGSAEISNIHRESRWSDIVLLTNGRGGMARMCVDLGRVSSKYDCVLGANLHPSLPVDRHVFAKRIRVWVNADGFISPLDAARLERFEPGPPARWFFVADAGDGRTVQIEASAEMLEGRNTTVFRFSRPTAADAKGKQLPGRCDVRLTIRVDVEDRSYHGETIRNPGAEHHFRTNTRAISFQAGQEQWQGFEFTPATDRQLRVFSTHGAYHPQEEWSHGIPHLNEQTRGQHGQGDAMSPGWFEIPLSKGRTSNLVLTADLPFSNPEELILPQRSKRTEPVTGSTKTFEEVLEKSASAFVVRRGPGATVIAGYPWFLDWGRDTFIAARGLIAAGLLREVQDIVLTFGRFEKEGTLPNTIFGEDASNRDTVDAPLWFGLVCEELSQKIRSGNSHGLQKDVFSVYADATGRTICEVLESIAAHYVSGTPNGIRMDPESGLIWSPSHFTWMDTNYPACTPRQGYAVEIQGLWVRLLRLLGRVGTAVRQAEWNHLAGKAQASIEHLFWMEERGYYSDVLQASPGEPAAKAIQDDALRSNGLFLVSLGISNGERARRTTESAIRHLVIPGALRSLAPLEVKTPLRLCSPGGQLLNNPQMPYWGRYEGDEDTRRKPAYHNGTAWVWTLPTLCEALAMAWDFSPDATAAAKAYLSSTSALLTEGCLGHLPEILDGDAPHLQRGCDAQAWSATETLRVLKLLQERQGT